MTATNLHKLLEAFGNQVQDLENALWTILLDTYLDVATGINLDRFGNLVGQAREGFDDTAFREAIRIRILINLCESTPEEILKIFSRLTQNAPLELNEYFPAALTLWAQYQMSTVDLDGDGVWDQARRFANYLQEARASGVLAHLIYQGCPPGQEKKFDTAGQGFDSGRWAGVLL
jgi:hypothetical protein